MSCSASGPGLQCSRAPPVSAGAAQLVPKTGVRDKAETWQHVNIGTQGTVNLPAPHGQEQRTVCLRTRNVTVAEGVHRILH